MRLPLILTAAVLGHFVSAAPAQDTGSLEARDPKNIAQTRIKGKPDCVYITAQSGGTSDTGALIIRNKADNAWTMVCGGRTNGDAADCCPGYSLNLVFEKVVGQKFIHADAAFKDVTFNGKGMSGFTFGYDVPQASFDASGCMPGRGGNPNGAVGCLQVSWTLNTCPEFPLDLPPGTVMDKSCGK